VLHIEARCVLPAFEPEASTVVLAAEAWFHMAIWDSLHHLDRAHRDAALAYAVQSGFFVALGVATIGEAVFASATLIFFGLGPFGWAFLIAIALTGWLASTLVDSPLERWAGFGPFAAENPMSQEYEGLDGESVFEKLRELLMRPSIRLTTEQGQFIEHEGQRVRFVEVRCEVPGFEPGHSQLQIEVTEQDWQELRIDRVTKPRQELVDPVEYKPLYSEETGGIIGVRRRYPADPRYIYRARMRNVSTFGQQSMRFFLVQSVDVGLLGGWWLSGQRFVRRRQ
jgi:hypothetical protein